MAISMNSILGFGSTVKLRSLSRSYDSSDQYPIWAKPVVQKFSVEAPPSPLLGPRSFTKGVRWNKIPLAINGSESSATDSGDAEIAVSSDQFASSNVQPNLKVSEKASAQVEETGSKRSPLTARERLRAARVLSRYTESKPSKQELGSKVLDALRESDKGRKRSGLPEAPTNLLDDSKRGLSPDGWKFDLPVGGDLLIILFSFVFISTVMFTTTFIVWRVGAIHFNEY